MRDLVVRAVVAFLLILSVGMFAIDWNQLLLSGGRRNTDDATLQGDPVTLQTRVSGYLTVVPDRDYQLVHRGDVLFQVEQSDYRARVDRAAADLAQAEAGVRVADAQVAQGVAQLGVQVAQIHAADAGLLEARQELARQASLLHTESFLQRDYQNAQASQDSQQAAKDGRIKDLAAAEAQVDVLHAQAEQARAQVAGRRAALDYARIQLGYTTHRGAGGRRGDGPAAAPGCLRRRGQHAGHRGAAATGLGGGELPRGRAGPHAAGPGGGGARGRPARPVAARPCRQPGAAEPGGPVGAAAGPCGRQLHQGDAARAGEGRPRPAARPGRRAAPGAVGRDLGAHRAMRPFGPLAPTALPPPKGADGKPQPGPPPITWLLGIGLAGAVLGSVISNLDTRLTAFSLADLRGGAGFGVDEAAWVSEAYNVAEVMVVPITPWLASIVSPRRAIAAAAALLTLAGAFVPFAVRHYPLLVALRYLQGLGGGALIPLLLLTVLRFTPMHQRVFGLAVYGLVTAVTPLLAESLAGWLVEGIGWQAIFYIGLAIGPFVVLLVMIGLPVEALKPDPFPRTDYAGMVLLALFAGTLTAALGQGQRLDWFDSPLIDSLFASAACSFAAFLLRELTTAHPLVDLGLLARRNFSGGLLMIFAFGFASLFTGSILPMFGQAVRGYRQPQVGAILIWGALAQLLAVIVLPFVLRALEARVVLALGLFAAALADRLATFIDSEWIITDVLLSLLLASVAQVLILVPTTIVSTSVLKPEDALSGGTIFNIVRNLAVTIGGAVMGGVLTVRERVHSFYITAHLVAGAPATAGQEAAGGGLGAVAALARAQATTQATADAFGWSGVAAIIAFAVVLLLKPTPIPYPPGPRP